LFISLYLEVGTCVWENRKKKKSLEYHWLQLLIYFNFRNHCQILFSIFSQMWNTISVRVISVLLTPVFNYSIYRTSLIRGGKPGQILQINETLCIELGLLVFYWHQFLTIVYIVHTRLKRGGKPGHRPFNNGRYQVLLPA
jgi:hypothetical protein